MYKDFTLKSIIWLIVIHQSRDSGTKKVQNITRKKMSPNISINYRLTDPIILI